MVFSVPISLSDELAPLARAGCRMIPRSLRKREFFGNMELKLNAVPLRRQFDAIVAEGDIHGQGLAIRRAASVLDRLGIAHPGAEAGPAVWRAYLAHIVDAAEDGDIARAKAVRAAFRFDKQLGGFNAPSGAPLPEGQIHGPSGVSAIPEASRLGRQVDGDAGIPSDGKEIARLILRAPDLDEAERIYAQYKRASHPEGRLFERFVHKAYRHRLDAAGERNKADEFYDVVESQDKDSVRDDIEFAFLVDEAKTAADIEGTGKPPEELLKAASQNPGAGIHIAKLISEARSLEEASEIWDIFKDAPVQTNKGSAYAAFAHALVRFDRSLAASQLLSEADMEGVSREELEAAMNRFYFLQDDQGEGNKRRPVHRAGH